MDCPMTAKYQPALACFSAPHQHWILQSLAHLAARQSTGLPLNAVVTTLPALLRPLPKKRQGVLTAALTQTTAQDIAACMTAGQASGRAPATIQTTVSLLAGCFASLRAEGAMPPQPVRRRHRLLPPTGRPTPIPDAALAACFQVIDSVRARRIFLCMWRCGWRVSEVCARAWDARDLDADTVRLHQGQGRVDRLVSLSPDVQQALAVWRAHHATGGSRFPRPQRHRAPLCRSQSHVLMEQYRVAAGLTRHSSPHCLRPTFAPHRRHAGVSLEVRKARRGQHALSLTRRSAQLEETTTKPPEEPALATSAQRQARSGRARWHAAPSRHWVRPGVDGLRRRIPSRRLAGSGAWFVRRSRRPSVRCPGGTAWR
jgi:integrase